MKFNYQARTKEGEIQTGTVEAASKEAAVAILQKHKLFITFLEEAETIPLYAKRIKIFEKISKKEIVVFSRQIAIMFKSKVSLVEALQVLAVQTKNPAFKEKILKMSEDVEGGTPLSQALARYPKLFSSFYISMVKSGEIGGTLSPSLGYIADHLEREYHLSSSIRGAMLYPTMVAIMMFLVFVVMTIFVIPRFATILEITGQELPLVTKIVIGTSLFFRKWVLIITLIFIGIIFFVFQYSRTPRGKKFFDRFFLRVPFLGNFLKMVYLSRFAENLSTLISGGLPIAQALGTTAAIVTNDAYQKIIFLTRGEVRRGESISSVLSRFPEVFPPVFTQMTMVGEKTGTLDSALVNIADFYKKEVERSIKDLLSVLEPVMIVFLGIVAGGLIASILMPLYQMAAF